MRIRKACLGWIVVGAAVAALVGCGQDTVGPEPGPGPGPGPETGPLTLTEIFMRPFAIQRPPQAGGIPTPALVEYYLSTFYHGGSVIATIQWSFPAAIGSVEPKTPNLGRSDATVTIRGDASPPLGFFDVEAHGQSGTDTSSFKHRFAVVENRWMKHQRLFFAGKETPDLNQWPLFLTNPGAAATSDSILYVADTGAPLRIFRIPAFADLNGPEPSPSTCLLAPPLPEGSNENTAVSSYPDVSPPALGRRELLFSSSYDPQFIYRCARQPCENTPPLRLWVVRVPDGATGAEFTPHLLTADTTYFWGGQNRWFAWQHTMPRWDPKATNPRARVAFLYDYVPNVDPLTPHSTNLWTADLVDGDGDSHSDSLLDFRQLTTSGGIASFNWHPDGSRIVYADLRGLAWLDPNTGASTRIQLPEPVAGIASPSVFWRPGEHTLVAFQGQLENLRNIYVWDEQDNTLTKVLPFPVSVQHNLFPRWHPTRKEIVYVSDYTTGGWSNSSTGPNSAPDRINPNSLPLEGMPRTLYPSTWVVSLE